MRALAICSVALLTGLIGSPLIAAGANPVKEWTQAGEIMPFEVIRNKVVASVRGDYVGAEFDAQTRTYRFRFVQDGMLVNIDVDARTGKRINRRQPY